jgi:hypothetical protein
MNNMNEPMDMDVDPVDGGPKPVGTGLVPVQQQQQQFAIVSVATAAAVAGGITKEEEARQAIDMLHGDDVGNRVAAAHRLDAVAAALGHERTREVCMCLCLCMLFQNSLDTVSILSVDAILYYYIGSSLISHCVYFYFLFFNRNSFPF